MRTRLAAAVAAIFMFPVPAFATPPGVDVAIVFLSDVSKSMQPEEIRIAREAHASAISSPEVLEAIAAGVHGRIAATFIEFAGTPTERVGWTIIDDPASARAFAERIRSLTAGAQPLTGVGAALVFAAVQIDRLPVSADRLVVDIVGDGVGTSWSAGVPIGRAALLARGAVINGLPLTIDPDERDVAAWYASAVVGGPGHFSMPLTRIDQMPAALRQKILAELY